MDIGTNLLFLIIFGLIGFGISKIVGINPYRIFSDIVIGIIVISLFIAMLPAMLNPENTGEAISNVINVFSNNIVGIVVGDIAGSIIGEITN